MKLVGIHSKHSSEIVKKRFNVLSFETTANSISVLGGHIVFCKRAPPIFYSDAVSPNKHLDKMAQLYFFTKIE